MVPMFWKKFIRRGKRDRKILKSRYEFALPRLEALETRTLLSVNANLNEGILSVLADTNNGTTQVEIVQAKANVLVEDSGQLVGSFAADQIQLIHFQYNQFALDMPVNASQIDLTGFPLTEADLNLGDNSLTAGVNVQLPDATALTLTGPVNSTGQFDLLGTAGVQVGGFPLNANFDLSNTNLTLESPTTLPFVGAVDFTGSLTPDGQYSLTAPAADVTISGVSLTGISIMLDNNGLTVDAHTTLPTVGDVDLLGSLHTDGSYSLTATAADFTVAGFTLTNTTATLDNNGLIVSTHTTLPIIGEVDLTGTLADGVFTFQASGPNFQTFGFQLTNVTTTLDDNGLTVGAHADLPVVGGVDFIGNLTFDGHYSLTANAQDFTVFGFTVSNATATLNNSGLTMSAHVTLPVAGSVDLSGSLTFDGHYNFQGTAADVNILGFQLNSLLVTVSDTSGATVRAHATLPVLNGVDFVGQVQSNGNFSLSATATNVDLLGFIHFSSIALTLNNTSLSLSASTTLPVVGDVTFTGDVHANGNFTISATAPHFTLLGFLNVDNATVALSFPNPTLTVSATVSLANIGSAMFTGTISAGGHYSFSGHADLTVAGFHLGDANLRFSDGPTSGIVIGPFTTVPLPVVGPVTIQGSYASGGVFSFDVDIMPSPPLVIGGIPFNRFHFGLTNTSLTFGAGVGINFTGLNIASAYLQGTITTSGDFTFLATVDVINVAGFGANGQLTFQKTGSQFNLTLHATANFIVATAVVDGALNFNSGQFTLTGQANVGVAGFTLSNTTFTATNVGGLRIALHSHTNIVNIGVVDFDGTLASQGASYVIAVHAVASFTVAGFNLASARLDIDNTHLSIAVHYVQAGVFTADFSGSMTSGGQFSLHAMATVGLVGFPLVNASLDLDNSRLHLHGGANAFVASVVFDGNFNFNGTFSVTGAAQANFAGFIGANAAFTLNNSGLTIVADVSARVAAIHVAGSISNTGAFSFTVNVGMNFAGFAAAGSLTLDNSGVRVSAQLNLGIMGFRMSFTGAVQSNGSFSFAASTGINFGPVHSSLVLTLNQGGFSAHVHADLDLTARVGFQSWSLTVGFRGTLDVNFAINTNGNFNASGNLTMTAYLGISLSVGIGFHVDNHQFCINFSEIGFSIWGVGFHPFNDACINY